MATKLKIRDLVGTVVMATAPGPSGLQSVVVLNSSAATCFVQLFDAATIGAVTLGTTTPDLEVEVGAGLMIVINLAPGSLLFGLGIAAASTTLEKGSVASAVGVEVFLGVV